MARLIELCVVGVVLNCGPCQLGNVKKGASKDCTAVGDAVNTTARLQSNAVNCQIVISESVYAAVADDVINARAKVFSVRGKSEPLNAYVLDYTDYLSVKKAGGKFHQYRNSELCVPSGIMI